MELARSILIVVLFYVGIQSIDWVLERHLLGQWLDRARVRLGRRIPPGRYVIRGQIGFHFGTEDAILVLTLPVQAPGETSATRFVGATDSSTQFRVSGRDATPDELLEAYDDELGPLEVQVFELGRIAEIEIATSEADSTRESAE